MVFSIIVCWMVHSYITLGICPTCFFYHCAWHVSRHVFSCVHRVVYFHSSDLSALSDVCRWIFPLQTVKKKKKVKKSFSRHERTPKQKRPFFNSFLKPSSTIASAVIDNSYPGLFRIDLHCVSPRIFYILIPNSKDIEDREILFFGMDDGNTSAHSSGSFIQLESLI